MSDMITIDDRKFVKYIPEKEIDTAIDAVAEKVNREYADDVPIILIVLNGGIVFGCDLMKRLTVPCQLGCIRVKSYSGTKTTEKVRPNPNRRVAPTWTIRATDSIRCISVRGRTRCVTLVRAIRRYVAVVVRVRRRLSAFTW